MFNNRIKYLFETENADTGPLTLKKTTIDDATLIKHLGIKPSEINIILARVTSFIQNDPQKNKKDLINDILEVLERSAVAREFVGIGLLDEYKLYKGFPVRSGDPYESMPNPNSELVLKPSELYIGWTTELSKAREDSIRYDAAKGEPIGGLLVNVHVDSTKILFDINALIKTVKAKKPIIEQYNTQAAPGKSISKSNIEFLANSAPFYYGQWEILTTNKITTVTVINKWKWDETSGKKEVKWTTNDISPKTQDQNLQEQIKTVFGNVSDITLDDVDIMNEGVWQGVKNIFNTRFKTMRGKMIIFLKSYVKFYESEKKMLEAAIQHAKNVGEDDANWVPSLELELKTTIVNLQKAKEELQNYQNENINNVESSGTNLSPQEQKTLELGQNVQNIKHGGDTSNSSPETTAASILGGY